MKRVKETVTLVDLKAMGATNIVARDLWPAAFDPHEPWSTKVFDARCKARRAAQTLRDANPAKFSEIVKDTLRRSELARLSEKQAELDATIRSRGVQ